MKTQVILGALLAGTFIFSACGSPKVQKPNIEKPAKSGNPDLVRLSPEAIRLFSVSSTPIVEKSASSAIQTIGTVKADANRVFRISSFTAGRLVSDRANLGDYVQAGQTVAAVQNLELAREDANYIHQLHQNDLDIQQAQVRLALAQKNLKREKELLTNGISPRKDYQQAEADALLAQSTLGGLKEHRIHINREARAMLKAYGTQPSSPESESVQSTSPIRSPRSGIITQKNVLLGDMVSPDKPLYEAADLSEVWLDLAIYPKDLATVAIGQTVTFKSDSLPGMAFTGHINYIPPAASTLSQTFIARAYLSNPKGLLQPGMLGNASIQQPAGSPKLFLPESAVQSYGKDTFVFQDLGGGQYLKVSIHLGPAVPGGYQVESPIRVGERVVTQGSFNLKAEMLKSQFGEGD